MRKVLLLIFAGITVYLSAFETFLYGEATQPVSQQAEEPSQSKGGAIPSPSAADLPPAHLPSYNFKLAHDTGWTICRDLLKYYNDLQPSEAVFSCEIPLEPGNSKFAWPQWQDLKLEDYLDVVYAIEAKIPPYYGKLPSFEVWRAQYLADVSTGFIWKEAHGGKQVRVSFHPRLRQTQVRFESNGRLETVLGYTHECLAGERCKYSIKACPFPIEQNIEQISEAARLHRVCVEKLFEKCGLPMDNPGEHIVLFDPQKRLVGFIQSGDRGAGISSNTSAHLFLHKKRAYLALADPSGITISRVERLEFENVAIEPFVSGRKVCDILPDYRNPNSKE